MITVKYVDKQSLYPAFGAAYPARELVEIRSDLPKNVQKFIVEHENYHILDMTNNWIMREICANAYGARYQFSGFLRCLWMSLAIHRLLFYVKRIIIGR